MLTRVRGLISDATARDWREPVPQSSRVVVVGDDLRADMRNADLKRSLADQVITDRLQMERSVRSFFHRVQRLPVRVLGYFQAPHTKYAALTVLTDGSL